MEGTELVEFVRKDPQLCEEFQESVRWIQSVPIQNTYHSCMNSYKLKHAIENASNPKTYISEIAAVAAIVHLGIKHRIIHPTEYIGICSFPSIEIPIHVKYHENTINRRSRS